MSRAAPHVKRVWSRQRFRKLVQQAAVEWLARQLVEELLRIRLRDPVVAGAKLVGLHRTGRIMPTQAPSHWRYHVRHHAPGRERIRTLAGKFALSDPPPATPDPSSLH